MTTAEFLKRHVDVFKEFSDERLRDLVGGSRVASFEENEAIAHRGAEATHFAVVLSGDVAVSRGEDGGERRPLGKLKTGDTFGELSLMTGDKLIADFIAASPCGVLLIPASLFRSVIVAEPAAARKISRTIAERMRALLADPSDVAAAFHKSDDPYGLELKGERPEKILVVNCGSSSLKYSFYDTADEARHAHGLGARHAHGLGAPHAHGLVERIGIDGTRLVHSGPKGEVKRDLPKSAFPAAFEAMVGALKATDSGVIAAEKDVSVVVHRVVHGGERFAEAALVDDKVLAELERLNPLAPLHNPVNVAGIRGMQRLFPSVPHVAVFDTSFHHTLSPHAYLYGLPYELYAEKAVRRYGFHGPSHQYVSLRAAQFLKLRPNELRIVTCHLGNGSSVCAVDHGRSVDTSMGFTPAEGLIMGTRCGDVDAGVLAFLERDEGMTAVQCEELLNKKSGLLGLSGISSDMREILKAADAGDQRALIALKTYCYRVRKYLGAYVASMGGVDAVVFTGGIGQGSAEVRALALQGLECMGIRYDEQRNRDARGFVEVCRISRDDSSVIVLVVPTDEERMMAREALSALSRSRIAHALEAQERCPIPVVVSPRHVHLSPEHVEALFGRGHRLTRQSTLAQPGQFECREEVAILGPKGRIDHVRVFGPERGETQVEIALTDEYSLGLHAPIRESRDIAGTPGCTLEGPKGRVKLEQGVISAMRHLDMTADDALRFGLRDRSSVRVRMQGGRELVFGDVLVRVGPELALALTIDSDEAHAAGVETGAQAFIEGIQSEG